ncbi:hypothetical protein FRB97_005394 [Tulasnella sp. 331]|nr:hypothetical protein FRB97_005394 [Tulasnella sp. 331]
MLAEHDSIATNLPTGKARRIRCKICRTELASQGHAVDHGQLDGSIPAGAPEAKQAGPLHFYALKSTQGDELPPEPDSDAVAVQATATSKRIMRSYTAAEGSSSQSSLSDVSKVSGAPGAQIMLGAVEAKLVSPPSSRATARQHRPTFPPPSRPPVARPRPTDDAQSASASTSLPVTGAILQELRINPTSGGPAPPIMIGPKCSGYFLEPVRNHFFSPTDMIHVGDFIADHEPIFLGLDEMDGSVLGSGSPGGEDHMPQREVRREAGELRLGWHVLQLSELGNSGEKFES